MSALSAVRSHHKPFLSTGVASPDYSAEFGGVQAALPLLGLCLCVRIHCLENPIKQEFASYSWQLYGSACSPSFSAELLRELQIKNPHIFSLGFGSCFGFVFLNYIKNVQLFQSAQVSYSMLFKKNLYMTMLAYGLPCWVIVRFESLSQHKFCSAKRHWQEKDSLK